MSDISSPINLLPAELIETVTTGELKALRAIMEGTAQDTGEEFFRSLVRNLSIATGVANAFIAEFANDPTRVRTLAFWKHGEFIENQEWELAGTPCEDVARGKLCHYPSGVWKQFPKEEKEVESYLGVPLQDTEGNILGHLALFDSCMMPPEPPPNWAGFVRKSSCAKARSAFATSLMKHPSLMSMKMLNPGLSAPIGRR